MKRTDAHSMRAQTRSHIHIRETYAPIRTDTRTFTFGNTRNHTSAFGNMRTDTHQHSQTYVITLPHSATYALIRTDTPSNPKTYAIAHPHSGTYALIHTDTRTFALGNIRNRKSTYGITRLYALTHIQIRKHTQSHMRNWETYAMIHTVTQSHNHTSAFRNLRDDTHL